MVGLRWPDYTLSECVGAKKTQFDCWFFYRLINLAGKLLMTMLISLVTPLPGGSRAFTLAAWNIRCGRNVALSSVAKGLVQMGVGSAIFDGDKGDGRSSPSPCVRVKTGDTGSQRGVTHLHRTG